MRTTTTGAHYGESLQAALDRTEVSVRELARRLNPSDPETARRSVKRYLRGSQTPTVQTREQIADALGLSRSDIEGDTDMVADLYVQLRAAKDATRQLRQQASEIDRAIAALLDSEVAI